MTTLPIVSSPALTLRNNGIYWIRTAEGRQLARYKNEHCRISGNPILYVHGIAHTTPIQYVEKATKEECKTLYLGHRADSLATVQANPFAAPNL